MESTEPISLRCPACDQPLKFPATRAGRQAKCTKCGGELTVPDSQPAAPPPPPPPAPSGDDEDGEKHYAIVTDTGPEKKKAPPKKKKKDKSGAVIKKRKKSLPDADKWAVVKNGLMLMYLGSVVWAGIYIMRVLLLLLGCAQGPEYGTLRLEVLVDPDGPLPGPGELGNLHMVRFSCALISGSGLLGFSIAMHIILGFLTLVQMAFFLMGYFASLVVPPDRCGLRGQLQAIIALGFFNVMALVFFRLLPLLGLFPFPVISYLVPEIPTVDANIGRTIPLHVLWSRAPFWELLITLVLLSCQYMEYNLGAVFLLSVGQALKEEEIAHTATGLIQIGMGTLFILLTYLLVSLCGCSDVMVSVTRLVYMLWSGFIFLFIIRYMMALQSTRAVLVKLVGDEVEKLEEEEDQEAQEERPPKKKKKKVEEEDEDDEEDDDDDEPRKRKKR